MIRLKKSFLLLALLFPACETVSYDYEKPLIPMPGIPDTQDEEIWISAYLGAWNHYAPPGGNWGHLRTEEIDWDAFSHLFYFSLNANEDGTLSRIEQYQNFSPDRIVTIIKAAHDHNKPVLFSIGGWGNYQGFSHAISDENRETFISNLVSVMTTWGFDGIDLDMEPIKTGDEENYTLLVNELYAKFQNLNTPLLEKPLLTVATSWKPGLFASLSEKFDQINLMTYDLSGAWHGWVSWHNAPLFNGGEVFESTGRPLPSANQLVDEYIDAGVPPEKLGIGIDFYGYKWTGFITDPLQTWLTPPKVTPNIPYYKIRNEYYDEKYYKWDDEAKAAYLSIPGDTPLDHIFISYDDEKAIESKLDYIREKQIGGAIIWELGGAHFKDHPEGKKDPLLKKVKDVYVALKK